MNARIIRRCFLLVFLLIEFRAQCVNANDQCKDRCANSEDAVVCGVDGRNYRNECELKCANVAKAFHGICSNCFREKAAKERNEAKNVFIPECNHVDGNYMMSQCHKETGYCWCVNVINGKPILNSSVKQKQPNCAKFVNKIKRKRRPRRGERKRCSDSDKKTFNRNLIAIFISELKRVRASSDESKNDSALAKEAMKWKFSELDSDKNEHLSRKEMKHFRRMLVKIIKPRHCSWFFVRTCDANRDRQISQSEWEYCLGFAQTLPENVKRDDSKNKVRRKPTAIHMMLMLSSSGVGGGGGGIPFLQSNDKRDVDGDDDEDEKQTGDKGIALEENCEQSRRHALENSAKNEHSKLFIPECNEKNSYVYKEVQCHEETGYCWCVDVRNGHPIQGTSAYMQQPNCKEKHLLTSTSFKGCSFRKKQRFIRELIASFENEMRNESHVTNSSNIVIIKWKFAKLDLNKNQKLERSEVKQFKKQNAARIKGSNLRKCWRNFFRFCDLDSNHIIDEIEWIQCCGEHDQSSENSAKRKPAPTSKQRRGPNPFSSILKAD
ncbi:Sparc-related modular calcium-binding protein 1-like protein [Dinothrombium tinctorium]|uniref:Sparc-related modular calcium-binding protein 1-like protein n=1 Tax=Dinothrombium tinctorium TaxID=1965070 RepID=A0A443R1Y3_9ACAR|nr:Sparc-related modular calcium-binding protein 1-like protein [Dinothrombium tinctorium]